MSTTTTTTTTITAIGHSQWQHCMDQFDSCQHLCQRLECCSCCYCFNVLRVELWSQLSSWCQLKACWICSLILVKDCSVARKELAWCLEFYCCAKSSSCSVCFSIAAWELNFRFFLISWVSSSCGQWIAEFKVFLVWYESLSLGLPPTSLTLNPFRARNWLLRRMVIFAWPMSLNTWVYCSEVG